MLYTVVVHGLHAARNTWDENAWCDLRLRMQQVRDQPYVLGALTGYPLSGNDEPIPPPADDFQKKYYAAYQTHWGFPPPCCYPKDDAESIYAEAYREKYKHDFRGAGLSFPKNDDETWYPRLVRRAVQVGVDSEPAVAAALLTGRHDGPGDANDLRSRIAGKMALPLGLYELPERPRSRSGVSPSSANTAPTRGRCTTRGSSSGRSGSTSPIRSG